MKKSFDAKPWFFPLPVLIIATYDENGNANAMNAAWGGLYDSDQVELCLSAGHKTTKSILARKAFTISFATKKYLEACDYVGLESGNTVPNKLEKAGFTTQKSDVVNAPIIQELPMCLECTLIKQTEEGNIIGQIEKISVDEMYITENSIDVEKMEFISFDPIHNVYRVVKQAVGKAFADGAKLK